MQKRFILAALFLFSILAFSVVGAQDSVELRITWYHDGNETDVLRGLLDQFEKDNAGIKIVIDDIAYGDTYHSGIQAQVEAGTAPDLARVNDVARFFGTYLDLRPLVKDAKYYETNFSEAVLNSMRASKDDTGIYGFPLQFTLTGPFINRTLFEQAGVPVPSDTKKDVTWEEWADAAQKVAKATNTPYAIAYEPRGHRFWGFAISEGGTFFDKDGKFTADSPGFRKAAQTLVDWNKNGLSDPTIWANKDVNLARDQFVNGQVVFIYSGSFFINGFAKGIGSNFDWSAVPNPTGPGGSTGSPGGSMLVAFKGSQHPQEVARLMDYLSSESVLEEFSVKSSFIPGHLGLVKKGLKYAENNDALNVFLAEIPKISEQAYTLQYSPYAFTYNRPIDARLSQVIVGEMTLDQAIAAIQKDVDDAIAASQKK
jgi:alpha-1,4-digalacturonate transport system substrate-binding protein